MGHVASDDRAGAGIQILQPWELTAWLVRRDMNAVSLQPEGILRRDPKEVGGGEWSLQAAVARKGFTGH